MRSPRTVTKVRWPSGLRRQLKALVRKGVGSNPTLIIFLAHYNPRSEFELPTERGPLNQGMEGINSN